MTNPVSSIAWQAIGMTTIAGLTTCIGSLAVLFQKFKYLKGGIFLSTSLGFSAGVLTYLAFAVLYNEAMEHFEEVTHNSTLKVVYSMLSLFGGVTISVLLDKVTHFFFKGETCCHEDHHVDGKKNNCELVEVKITSSERSESDDNETKQGNIEVAKKETNSNEQKMSLRSTSLITTISVILHNIPEGIITCIAFVSDPMIGYVLILGIIAHNIPLGVSIALPYKIVTGSNAKAFLLTLIAGLSEPLGSIICILVFRNKVNELIFAILFGFAAGAMIYAAFFELLPQAYSQQKNQSASISFLVGTGVIMLTGLFSHEH